LRFLLCRLPVCGKIDYIRVVDLFLVLALFLHHPNLLNLTIKRSFHEQ